MPIQIWILILPQALQMLENMKNFVDFYAAMPIYAVVSFLIVTGFILFNILDNILTFSGKSIV
jgi:hypothetical protein